MAKPADIAIDPGAPFTAAGARIVRVRAEELFAHGEGVLDTDKIEGVHDMRVATRRLRAALEVFAPCFPRGDFKGVLRDVKQLADALGERRDPDVHVAALEAFAEAVGAAQKPGIRTYADRQRRRQEAGNVLLAAALAHAEASDLAGRLQRLAAAADPEPDPEPEPEPEAEPQPEAEPA